MLKSIINGISAYFSAFEILRKLKLWKYFAVPMLISFLLLIIILTASFYFAEDLGNSIAGIWDLSWAGETVSTISHIVGGMLIFIFGLVIYKHVVLAFSAPFMSPVSEKIEGHFYQDSKPQNNQGFSSALARGVKINIRNLGKELLFVLPLFVLSLIPVIGFVFSLLIFIVQAYYAGFGNMDYTLERHLNYKESIFFVKKNRGVAIGNGIGFMVLLLLPIIGCIIVLPMSVVAASTMTLKKLHEK